MAAGRRRLRAFAVLVCGALALACAGLLLLVALWAPHTGLANAALTVAHIVWRGPPTVYDHRDAPGRPLVATHPQPLAVAAQDGSWARLAVPHRPGVDLATHLQSNRTLAFLVVRQGSVVYSHMAAGHRPQDALLYFSVSKSVLATLVGLAIDDGILAGLDMPVTQLVPEVAGRGLDGTTLRHLIDMTSALDYTEDANPLNLYVPLAYTPDQQALVLRLRGSGPDGGAFRYRSGETALLSLALQRALKPETIAAYTQRRLWGPLGMAHAGLWSLDRTDGLEKAWCCLAGTAHDLAKLGQLYLDGGRADGRQIISPGWVAASRPTASTDGQRHYAQGWWPGARGTTDFAGIGKDGQFLYVSPTHGTVVVRLGEHWGPDTLGQWLSLLSTVASHRAAPGGP